MVNEWTRDDLPDASVATDKYGAMKSMYFPAVDDYRDAVVAHLNANGGMPADGVNWEMVATDLQGERNEATARAEAAESDRDRWRRAHAIVEQERDQARSERDDARRAAHRATERAEAAERERDEALEASSLFQRDVHEWRTRAEAAEARTAPAVTRDEIEIKTCNQCGRDANAPSGLSASSVYYHRYGIAGNSHTPGDAGDFGRCVDYLGDTRPVWMSDVSPEWGRLVCHWGELLDLYRDRSTRQEVTHRIRVLNMAPDEQPARHVLGQEAKR